MVVVCAETVRLYASIVKCSVPDAQFVFDGCANSVQVCKV
jgi:hypothetical protein